MKGFESPYVYYCLGNFLFVATCLICATIRWSHVCREYRKHINFYFPTRKIVTCMLVFQLLQSFYWMNVYSEEAFFFVSLFGVLIIPPFFVMLERRFFSFSSMKRKELLGHFLPPSLILLPFLCATLDDRVDLSPYVMEARILATVVFMVESFLNIKIQIRIWKILRGQFEVEYSDLSLLPKVFTDRKRGLTFCWSLIPLLVLWTDSRSLKLGMDLFLTVVTVQFLLGVLNTRRKMYVDNSEEEIKGEEDGDQAKQKPASLSDLQRSELEQRIVSLLESECLFKQPDLSLDILAKYSGSNRSYISETISMSSYGSFYKMINRFRLEYARQQLEERADVKLEQLAIDAGFSSRYMLTRSFKEFYGMTPTEWKKKRQLFT